MSINYYDTHAENFIKNTFQADMTSLYKPFLSRIEKGGLILDIGCGSGRDSKKFQEMGYQVYAHDASRSMVEYTKKFLGDHVKKCLFEEFNPEAIYGQKLYFDGLWACSSLLHVPKENIISVINNYTTCLKKEGIFFMSFKDRGQDYEKDGRWFNNYRKEGLEDLIKSCQELEAVEYIETKDVREDREEEGWISLVARKVRQ